MRQETTLYSIECEVRFMFFSSKIHIQSTIFPKYHRFYRLFFMFKTKIDRLKTNDTLKNADYNEFFSQDTCILSF